MAETDIDRFLNDTNNGKLRDLPELPKYGKTRKSKIELAGEHVMNHLMRIGRETDLSYSAMAKSINEKYKLDLSKDNVIKFFNKNKDILEKAATEHEQLGKLRAKLYLEHNNSLVHDIKLLNDQIGQLEGDEGKLMDLDKRSKAIRELVDSKGSLLMRYAKLSGKIDTNQGNVQNIENLNIQNIYEKVEEEESDVIKKLKSIEFQEEKEKKVIDIAPVPVVPKNPVTDENNPTDNL